jgi:hypothetical protein
MLKLPQLLALLTLFGLTACGGGGGSSASTSATSGYALSGQFQKGPFAIGSQISANELDAGLNPTGRVYNVQTADDLGRFTVPTRIENKLVELVGDGFYMDELTGQLSSARIQLRAIADLSLQQPVTVNILTSLQGLRLKRLIALGSTYTSADTQSRNEVLQAFGITPSNINSLSNLYSMQINGTTDQDAVLLAISSVISKMAANAAGTNGTSQPAELSNYVNTISSQIESSGFITNAAYITAMNLAASQVDLSSVRTNVINYYASRGVTVTPPNFEEWIDKAGTGQLPQRMGSGYAAGTGSLAAARSGHTSTLLANGKVLLAGGQGDLIAGARAPIRTSEIYDPNNGTWAATSNLAEARSHHTSVRLGTRSWRNCW